MTRPKHVLVVEDSSSNADLAEALLSLEGWRVTRAGTAEGALVWLAVSRPDVVLLDLLLPGMGGTALLRHMAGAEGLRSIPVVVFTAAAGDLQDEARAAHPGVTVLQKPAERHAILRALADAAAGGGAG
jgi:CheY-like chemotaxis protein